MKILSINNSKEHIGLFQTEENEGIVLDRDEIAELSVALSRIYIELIENFSQKLAIKNSISKSTLDIICRTVLPSLIYFFFERLYRIKKAVNQYGNKLITVNAKNFTTPNTIEELEELISNENFNQKMIVFLSDIWKINKLGRVDNFNAETYQSNVFKNYLFVQTGTRTFLTKVFFKTSKFLNHIFPSRYFLTLGLANLDLPFHLYGFYFKHFKRLEEHWDLPNLRSDLKSRKFFFDKSLIDAPSVIRLLKGLKFSDTQIDNTLDLLIKFIQITFPIQFYEGLKTNVKEAKNLLSHHKSKVILTSGGCDNTKYSFLIGVAKANGYKIIVIQHGGHYGYIKDQPRFFEKEYVIADQFITWGWLKSPKHLAYSSLNTFALPSPWLSERVKYWKNYRPPKIFAYDIIWFPQRMQTCTQSLTGSGNISSDVIRIFSKEMIDLITVTSQNKIKVYCKPYNQRSVIALSKTYEMLCKIGVGFFNISNDFSKGLNYKVLDRGRLILWDQPGTGFLECLTSGIPTIVLWTRFFCEEEDWCRKDFRGLEKAGIIHRTTQSLINELRIFLSDPALWMNDSKRKLAVQSFTYKYALTDDQWWKTWHTYLKQLRNEINEKY